MKEKENKKEQKVQTETVDAKIEETEKQATESSKYIDTSKELDRDNMTDQEYIEGLEEKVGLLMQETVVCRQLTQRIQADFDNYRKRNQTLSEEMKQLGISMVVEKMLTVLDNCDFARKYLTDESALTGFNMMETQIISALEGFGLQVIEADGKEFNAKLMNALEREKAEGKEGMVLEVQSKGYTLNGKVIRPSGVKVGF